MPGQILLVEDNPANLELMNYLLQAYGYATVAAADGVEGLEAVRREHPDLIICDVQLPVLDGYEVARQLKADTKTRLIPLVAVTALAMVGDRDKVLAAGFDGYIAKPIEPETFVRQVEAYLPYPARSVVPGPVTRNSILTASAKLDARHTLLVVDNLSVNLEFARSLFEPHGYRVLTAESPAEALALARQERCDLILSDVCMPDASGYDLIQIVKADLELRTIPFVFLTSTKLEAKDRAKGLALGAERFLMRPIEPQALLAEIEACLRNQETV